MLRHWSLVAAIAAMTWPRVSTAQETMTLEDALARARDAAAIRAVNARVEEARGRLAGARALFAGNPVVEGLGGRRESAEGESGEWEVSLRQPLGGLGGRGARVRGAAAAVAEARARAADEKRLFLRDVAVAFIELVALEERVEIAGTTTRLAEDVSHAAARRFETGDFPQLDLNLARVAHARARSELRSAEADREAAIGVLRALLGLESARPIRAQGDLSTRSRYSLDELLAAVTMRADIAALDAAIEEARAEVRFGRSLAGPQWEVGGSIAHEEDAEIALAGISVTFPLFARGQEERIRGAARIRRLTIERDALRHAAEVEVRSAWEVHRLRSEAADSIGRDALAFAEENEALVRRSYDAGEISLADWILIRRESLESRLEYLERSRDAAIAAIHLESAAGALK